MLIVTNSMRQGIAKFSKIGGFAQLNSATQGSHGEKPLKSASCRKTHPLGVLALVPTEKVPLNLIEVILAQGSTVPIHSGRGLPAICLLGAQHGI